MGVFSRRSWVTDGGGGKGLVGNFFGNGGLRDPPTKLVIIWRSEGKSVVIHIF